PPLLNFDGTLDDVALADFKRIELQARNGAPQQTRWPSSNIADSAQEALNRLVLLPGAHYNAPVFSVRAEFPPAGLGFLSSSALGPQYQDALFVGEARDFAYDGALLLFHPTADRNGIDFMGDPNVRAADGVFLNDKDFDL